MTLKLFSSDNCKPCVVLKMILNKRNIYYEEVNIETEEGYEEAKKYGIMSIPTLVNGEKVYVGLPTNVKDLEKVLEDVGKNTG